METAPPKQTVLFGGDTNLRDKEVEKFCLPTSIHDVWEMIGSPSESRYTWDQTSNDNKVWPFRNRSRLRFDRLYLRHPETMSEVLAPNTFDLLGRERLSCNKFPSDHWGIVCDFQYNIWNMRGTKANTNGPRKRRNERSNNSQEIPTTAATNTMTTMEEGTDMIDQSDVYVNRTASTGSRSSRRKEMRQKKGLLSKCFHVGKYVLLVLILPAILNHASLYREAAELKPKGELYDVGWNHKLQLNCAGSGAPTVVLDAPTGMTSDVWCLIQPRIAKFTRVCSYDRAGLGFSERTPMNFSSEAYTVVNKERGQPSTVERMAEDLYHLLRFSSDQPLPFILVGSEIGSLNARFFTQMYESAVADLVLVDPLVEGMFELDDGIWNSFWFEHLLPSFQSLQLSAAIGLSRIVLLLGLMELPITGQVIPEDVVIRQKYLLCQPRHLSSIVDEHYFINQSLSQLRTAFQIKPFPESVSVTVITGNYYDDQLPSSLNKVWAKSQQHLMSKIHPNAKHILINGADHHMLYRNPNAIVEPVRKLVKQWRARNSAAYQRSLKTNTDSPPQ
ncbi:uncharacterized protein LOC110980430 isoform X2 [Acanthaster planci]|uniref:Uncharacterized protein LOC110980430 isoform X2 n=1 Tax=Acanthaster planci TaxID=133434 RepID=A0A8B7YMT5_ACAPL|nr:uncharacterized protein LOC110980430 isoform X2 [Acanthaster planci]